VAAVAHDLELNEYTDLAGQFLPLRARAVFPLYPNYRYIGADRFENLKN